MTKSRDRQSRFGAISGRGFVVLRLRFCGHTQYCPGAAAPFGSGTGVTTNCPEIRGLALAALRGRETEHGECVLRA